MKKKIALYLLLFTHFSIVHADCMNPFKVEIGPVYSHVKMTDFNSHDYKGHLWGVKADFEYQSPCCLYVNVNALWNEGTLHGHNVSNNRVKEGVWDGEIGYSFCLGCCNEWEITPVVGLGFRLFKTHTHNSLGNTVKIDYKNIFIPVGLKLAYHMNCEWTIGLKALVMPSIDQKLYVHNVEDTYWKQSKLTSYSIELPITWQPACFCDNRLEFSLVPFYKYWKLGQANAIDLPASKQTYWGAEFLIGYKF